MNIKPVDVRKHTDNEKIVTRVLHIIKSIKNSSTYTYTPSSKTPESEVEEILRTLELLGLREVLQRNKKNKLIEKENKLEIELSLSREKIKPHLHAFERLFKLAVETESIAIKTKNITFKSLYGAVDFDGSMSSLYSLISTLESINCPSFEQWDFDELKKLGQAIADSKKKPEYLKENQRFKIIEESQRFCNYFGHSFDSRKRLEMVSGIHHLVIKEHLLNYIQRYIDNGY